MTAPGRCALTVFRGPAGDHNTLAMAGAENVGQALARRLGLNPTTVGTPQSLPYLGWEHDLAAARPDLGALSTRYDRLFAEGYLPVAALSRCAVSLATLPIVAKHRPDACIVWLDAHADLNVPATTPTGYLGGLVLSAAAGLWDSGLGGGLPLKALVLVGQRDLDAPEQALVEAEAICVVPPNPDLADTLRDAIDGRPVYFHLDCDVLEPGIVPTDYIMPDGLTLGDLRRACTVVAESEIVGIEIAEFQAVWQTGGAAASPDAVLDALAPLFSKIGATRG